MPRIIIAILLLGLTFCPNNMALAVTKLPTKPKLASAIDITNPKLNDVWKQNSSYTIKWNKFGNMPNTAKIVLLNSPGETVVHIIKESVANNGSYLWKIPGSISPGKYKIQVRASSTRIYDRSDEFKITRDLKAMPVDLSSKNVFVTHPKKNMKYPPDSTVTINWSTDIPKEILKEANPLQFDIDLYDKDGALKKLTIEKDIYYFDCLLTGNKYRKKWFWKLEPDTHNIKTGQYKIKVTPKWTNQKPAGIPGFSGKFQLSRGVEKETVILAPTIRNRYSRKIKYYTQDKKKLIPPLVPDGAENIPGSARVGFHNFYHPKGFDAYMYHGFVFRSQLTFPMDEFKAPGKMLLKAELYLKVDRKWIAANYGYTKRNTCSKAIYYMTGPWAGKCTDTPGFIIKSMPDKSELVLDITQWAQNWYTGSEPNHGLLLLACDERFEHYDSHCLSWYKAELVLEFLQGSTK